jgi:DNA ligase-1
MNSDQIFDHLADLATVSGNAKLDRLRPLLDSASFVKVVDYALNPYKTYGIDDTGEFDELPYGKETFTIGTYDLLDALESRKLTGNAARDGIRNELGRLSLKSGQILIRILKKDLRCGVGIASVNNLKEGLIPVFDVMLAHPFDPKRVQRFPVVIEPKKNGFRVVAMIDTRKQEVEFLSRKGIPFTTFEMLKPHLLKGVEAAFGNLPVVFDGEVITGSFKKTSSELRRKSEQAIDAEYHVFEIMTLDEFNNGCPLIYTRRRLRLEQTIRDHFKGAPIFSLPLWKANSTQEIEAHAQRMWDMGQEGVMIKDPSHLYEKKRSYSWMKLKKEQTADVRVIGAYYGDLGKRFENTLGGLLVDYNGVVVKVGGGYSVKRDGNSRDEFLEAILNDLGELGLEFKPKSIRVDGKLLKQKAVTLDGVDESYKGKVLGRLIEVEYHEETEGENPSLQHPRFSRFRDTLTGDKE